MDKHEPQRSQLMSMKLERLLSQWPSTAQILIAHRMACVGCDFAKFHTTRQALEIYGLEAEFFLSDLANAIRPQAGRGSHSNWRRSDIP